MAGWQLHDYQAFLDAAEHFSVVTHNTEFVGFTIAYSHLHAHLDPWLHSQLAQHLDEYILHEQMCIAPGWTRRGVGTHLITQLLDRAGDIPVLGEIARRPLNTASVTLHTGLGFTRLTDLTRPNGLLTTIWISRSEGSGEQA